MPVTTPSSDVPPLEMIGAMTQCAYQLGVTASGIAQSAGDDLARFLAFSTEFRHCFFAVRMGIRLSQFEVVAPRVAAAASVETPDRERTERADRDDARGRRVEKNARRAVTDTGMILRLDRDSKPAK